MSEVPLYTFVMRFVQVPDLISLKVFKMLFCKSKFLHEFVNVFFIIVIVKDKLTNFWGN